MNKMRVLITKILLFTFLLTNILGDYCSTFAITSGSTIKKEKVQILIKYKDDSKSETVKSKAKIKLKLNKLETKKKYKLSKVEVLEIDSNDNINKVLSEFKKDTNVEYVQANYKLKPSDIQYDERFGEEWGLKNSGQTIQWQKGTLGIDINAEEAWKITEGSPSVIVGIADTGIDINHYDLKENIFINTNEVPNNGIDDDGNGYIDDVNGWDFANEDNTVFDSTSSDTHGTQVAGIIAANADDNGIRGIASKVKILPLKFINDGEGYTSDVIDSIEYAKHRGVKIMNCSFGGSEDNQVLKDAMATSDMLFVCAAGNDGSSTPIYPAAFGLQNVISVGAVDNTGEYASFSNYGENVNVAAPGVSILSTIPKDMYNYASGTSMATAYVTGTAALVESIVPNMTATQLSTRIKSSSKVLDSLKNKVTSSGIVDAANALNNSVDSSETGNVGDVTNNSISTSTSSKMITLAAAVSEELLEQIHYGEDGVNIATGNYSKSITDMSVKAPGFTINISRTYNSKDKRTTSTMGKGWIFGFEGNLKQDTTYTSNWNATLPNGGAQVFVRNSNGTFTANDSHSTLVKETDGSYTLTTKDQYIYGFNSTGYLVWMKDRDGNTINITVDSNGKVTTILDSVGRSYTITYKNFITKDLITSVTDPLGRKVQFQYDTNNRLYKVIDPNSNVVATYEYDSSGYLTSIADYYGTITNKVTYTSDRKVSTYTDVYGNVTTYTYDTVNRVTTMTDNSSPARVIKKWYDTALYIVKSQDPEGKLTTIEYITDANGYNKYGEEKSITDRNGNKTLYERDTNGNITKITNPDGSFRQYTYDSKNNETMEKDETGKFTYSIYDEAKVNLLKKVQPLNGADAYSNTADQTAFAITTYTYYTDAEAFNLGYNAKGLLKSVTDPEGHVTTYTYDSYGNQKTITDPEGNTTTNNYNVIGWLTSTISPKGYRTEYYYDNNGLIEKNILNNGETTRTVYDPLGRKIQHILPNQYDILKEVPATRSYSDTNAGYRYTYYNNGKLKSEIMPEKDTVTQRYYETNYTYDKYGNLVTETKTNGVIYNYDYDVMNRQISMSYKRNSTSTMQTLETYTYNILSNGSTTKTITKNLNDTDKAVTTTTYDYADREILTLNPNGTKITTTYNPNGTMATKTDANGGTTYIRYDGLNRVSETWSPIEIGKFSYSAFTYYRDGNKKEEKLGKDKVALYDKPLNDRLIVKTYTYYSNDKIKFITDTSGGNIYNEYDNEGFLKSQSIYVSSNKFNLTEYEYNHLGKIASQKVHVNKGDIFGNDFLNTNDVILTTIYSYNSNGNLEAQITPNRVKTTFTYDNMNRQIGTSKVGRDERGLPVKVKTSKTYNFADKVLTETDENGNITSYTYDERNFLIKKTDARGGVTAYYYDYAGRKIAVVSPVNYDATKTIEQMDHTAFSYDLMDRAKTQTEVFNEKRVDPLNFRWTSVLVSLVVKAYKYDNNGNVIKELDGEGYKSGSGTTADDFINSGYGVVNTYNLANQLLTTLSPVSKDRNLTFSLKYDYDGAGRKISQTRSDGVGTVYYYDDAGNLLSTAVKKNPQSPEQTIKSSTYDYTGKVITETDGNGNTTIYEYNSLGKVRKAIYPGDDSVAENIVANQYDTMGNLAKKQNSLGLVQLFTYDNEGRLLTSTEQDESGKQKITIATSYDKVGNKRFETDGNGNIEENVYDQLGNLIESILTVTSLDSTKTMQSTKYTYDLNGNQTSATDWKGNTTRSIYDPINRLIEKIDAYGKSIMKIQYNANHTQIMNYDALGNLTQYSYDKDNRLIVTSDPEGNKTKQTYDNAGLLSSKIDGNENATTYVHDEFDRLIKVTNALGENTLYTYDLRGNKITQTDGKGNTTIFEYNVVSKLKKKIDAGGRTGTSNKYEYINSKVESYTYFSDGNMATKLDRNGKTTNYKYDIHGRVLSQSVGTNSISYSYDNNGNQLTITDSTGTTTRVYDELNRVISKSVPRIGTNTYRYDRVTGLQYGYVSEVTTDAKGNVTTKVYDRVGRISEVKNGANQVATYQYYDNGNQKSVIYQAGAREDYTYYKNNLLNTLVNKDNMGNVIESFSYFYDGAKNQIKKIDYKGNTLYTYDVLNRLVTVTEPSGTVTQYTYDSAGNRLTQKVTQNSITTKTDYIYNEQNRMIKTIKTVSDGSKETTVYSYDNNGNMTAKFVENIKKVDPLKPLKPSFGIIVIGEPNTNPKLDNIVKGIATFEYDEWNQLIKSSTGSGTTINQYNGEGLRVQKTVNGKITKYVYEYDRVVLETDASGKQIARNILGNNLLSRTVDGQTINYLYNGHADVTALLNSAGQVIATYYYDAFGNQVETTGTINNPYTYSGYQFDNETGLYYLNARMYDSATARFMQEDTYRGNEYDPLSLNLYTYCSNEPIMYSDPTGHTSESVSSGTFVTPLQTIVGTIIGTILTGIVNNRAESVDGGTDRRSTKVVVAESQARNMLAFSGNSVRGRGGILPDKTKTSIPDIKKATDKVASNSNIDLFSIKPEDVTRDVAKFLIGNPINVYATQQGWFKELFYAGGFVRDSESGVYHARQEWSLQSFKYSGYNDFYDTVFHYATSMDKAKFQFSYDNKEYIFWAWKGDYLNLGAGAEMGIYSRMVVNGKPKDHWIVDQSLAMPMTLTLDYKGERIISYDPKKVDPKIFDSLRKSTDKWWVTGFNPDYQDVKASDLKATYTATFNTKAMYDNFYKKYGQGKDKDSRWTFDPKTNTGKFKF